MQCDVLVIGAGAAGIIAAWRAANAGARVVLLEKTERVGTKILISGGGRCNVTHRGSIRELLSAFRRNEAAFLRPALYRFTNEDVVALLRNRGIALAARPDNRYFPTEATAKEVVDAFTRCLHEANVDLRLNAGAVRLLVDGTRVVGASARTGEQRASCTVVATGGSSYPKSGTTGDAWQWLRELGHRIVPIRAALAPIYLADPWTPETSGVSLKDCLLSARQNGKSEARWRGDLLFTHRGVSGPCALGVSRVVAERLETGDVSLDVDLCPDESFERLGSALRRWQHDTPKKGCGSFVESYAPAAASKLVLSSVDVPSERRLQSLTRREFNAVVAGIKGWQIGRVVSVPLEKGECVAGGASLDEIDPQTCASKLSEGLYICGEALDIAGAVGGYNLQAAFSTGYVSGESAARACGIER
jgi:predicted Rossmann fold flavoprotein